MSGSSIGHGHQPFGHPHGGSPFAQHDTGPGSQPYLVNVGYGIGDWAEEVTWSILPMWMRDEDGTQGVVPEPLRGFIDAVKPLLNELIKKWRAFPSLWDAQTCPIDQLPALAATLGLTLDPTKQEALQRSETLNAAQLFVHKGDNLGYLILAAFEDLLVQIIPLWASDCSPTATLSPDEIMRFIPHFDDVEADMLPLDSVFDDIYAKWPITLYFDQQCRSHSLRLVFFPSVNPTQDFDPDTVTRLVARLTQFTPIHVKIDRITFDGLRGSSQVWIAPILADAGAAGMWMGPVAGEQRASSQVWIGPVNAVPTP